MVFPFAAIVGQEEMKLALLVAAVEPAVGGVLVFGDRGTGKSTAVRALAALLPPMRVVAGCRYDCDPGRPTALRRMPDARPQPAVWQPSARPVPVVDLPLGATEDRVVGALDLERALAHGEKAFEPGLLARAHRGFLYIDEVNLLEDHLVDLLLDVAASGENLVEREGLSVRHPARFVLVGSGNPEEGELRPQLLDRFGLSVEVQHARGPADPDRGRAPARRVRARSGGLRRAAGPRRRRGCAGRSRPRASGWPRSRCPTRRWSRRPGSCIGLGTDGLRGELTLMRAARALASLEGDAVVERRAPAPGRSPPPCATGCGATRSTRPARRVRVERARRGAVRARERWRARGPAMGRRGSRPRPCSRSTRRAWAAWRCARLPGRCATAGWPCCATSCPRMRRGAGCRSTTATAGSWAASTSRPRSPPAGRSRERGLLAEADGGIVVLAMAERLPPATAARLAAVLDTGEVRLERDGLTAAHAGPARRWWRSTKVRRRTSGRPRPCSTGWPSSSTSRAIAPREP